MAKAQPADAVEVTARRSRRINSKVQLVPQTAPVTLPSQPVTATTPIAKTSKPRVTKSAPKPSSKSTSSSSSSPAPGAQPQTISFPSEAALDIWLTSNGTSTPAGIWLKIAKKSSGIPTVTYDQAIDVGLCHGWIDGQRKTLDADYFVQRFTPRRKNSLWSQRNVDKVSALTAAGRMRPGGQAEVDAAKEDGRWGRAYAGAKTIEAPPDFEQALSANKAAKATFESLNRTQRYPILWRIITAKREETRNRKITEFVDMLAKGKAL